MTHRPTAERVGFVGLGNQGEPIARHMIAHGLDVRLWARRAEVLAPFAAAGAQTAPSAAELAAACDVVGVCVWDGAGVDDVVAGAGGLLEGARPGTMIVVHSTVRPDTCVELARTAATRGVDLVEAPVSGGPEQSAAGTLLVMFGGAAAQLERCRPIFDTFASHVVHLGGVGAASTAKLLNNSLLTANLAVAAMALDLGAELGIEPDAMLEVVINGSATSFGAGMLRQARAAADNAAKTRSYLDKDVNLLVRLASGCTADGMIRVAEAGLAELARRSGNGASDDPSVDNDEEYEEA